MAHKKPAKKTAKIAHAKKAWAYERPWIAALAERVQVEVEEEDRDNSYRKKNEKKYFGDDTFAHEQEETLDALLRAPRIEVVWKAIERRSDPDAITSREQAYLDGRSSWEEERSNPTPLTPKKTLSEWCLERELANLKGETHYEDIRSGRNIFDLALDLLGAVTEIRCQPVPMDTIGRRRAKLKEVRRATETLLRALDPLYSGARRYRRRHLNYSLFDKQINVLIRRWIEPHAMLHGTEIDEAAVAVAYQTTRSNLQHPREVLEAFVANVEEWSNEPPELARPNDPNAARLLFIRNLTAYFRATYGEPLRACVLAICEAFYDCDSLDDAAIAKLAP